MAVGVTAVFLTAVLAKYLLGSKSKKKSPVTLIGKISLLDHLTMHYKGTVIEAFQLMTLRGREGAFLLGLTKTA